jgi:anti-sigma B factor antagonist
VPHPASRLFIEPTTDGLALVGEIDAHTCADLVKAIDPLPHDGGITLDMSGVSFMDSSGLRVLVETHHRADEVGRRLVVSAPSTSVRRVLEISGLMGHLDVVPAEPNSED